MSHIKNRVAGLVEVCAIIWLVVLIIADDIRTGHRS